jgi:hypothetical protein
MAEMRRAEEGRREERRFYPGPAGEMMVPSEMSRPPSVDRWA